MTRSGYLILIVLLYLSFVQSTPARVLIYSATAGFRHDSIPTAITVLRANGASINVEFVATEDKAQFTETKLSGFDAIMFLSTTGEVLDDAGKQAFQSYLDLGGNFIGIHSASDCLVNTTFYGRELGAYFDFHADLQDATVDVLDSSHPSTSKLPVAWRVRDEMYNFKSDPRGLGATVVLTANESSYVDTREKKYNQGTPHPIAWYQTAGAGVSDFKASVAGRSFYTSLGHLNETWQDDLFMSHVLGGVFWVLQGNTTRAMNSSGLVGNSQEKGTSSVTAQPTTVTPMSSTGPPQLSGATPPNLTVAVITLIAIAVGFGKVIWSGCTI